MHLPALIPDMSFADYLADPMPAPSVTSSILRTLLSSAPRKVWHQTPRLNPDAAPRNRASFDLGIAAHAALTGVGGEIVVIEATDYRSKDAKAARDEAYAAGKTPLLAEQAKQVEVMMDAASDQLAAFGGVLGGIRPIAAGIIPEASIFWHEAGVNCRCRPDFWHKAGNVVIHYKTTATEIAPDTLAAFAARQGWDLIAAHYEAGIAALTGSAPRQCFVVQEVEAPHLLIAAELDATFIAEAKMLRDLALHIWGRCLATGTWPGHLAVPIKLECPEWHERNTIARKDAYEAARAGRQDLLDMSYRWQAPQTEVIE